MMAKKRKKKKNKNKKLKKITEKARNPVAKFASKFNKSGFFKDDTKYDRKKKHKNNNLE